jgi:hypothetical protein
MNANHPRQNNDPVGQPRRLARNENGDALVVCDPQQNMRYMYDDLTFDALSTVNEAVAHERMASFLVRTTSSAASNSKADFVNDNRLSMVEETLGSALPVKQKICYLGHLGVRPLAQVT